MKLKNSNYRLLFVFVLFFTVNFIAKGQVESKNIIKIDSFDFDKNPVTKTLKVSKNFKTVLIFPDEIIDDFLGNELEFLKEKPNGLEGNFAKRVVVLTYNRLAKNIPNKTNYTIITKDGNFYEFFLEKVHTLKATSAFIKKSHATKNIFIEDFKERQISTSTQKVDDVVNPIYTYYTEQLKEVIDYNDKNKSKISKWYKLSSKQMDSLYKVNKTAYLKLKAHRVLKEPKKGRTFFKKGNLLLRLKGLYYDKNEIYMVFLLQNKEALDFDIDFIKTKINTNYKKRSSKQSVTHKPIMLYNIPKQVKGKSEEYFMIAFNKFSVSQNRELLIDIKEKEGERDLNFKIPDEYISNPLKLTK